MLLEIISKLAFMVFKSIFGRHEIISSLSLSIFHIFSLAPTLLTISYFLHGSGACDSGSWYILGKNSTSELLIYPSLRAHWMMSAIKLAGVNSTSLCEIHRDFIISLGSYSNCVLLGLVLILLKTSWNLKWRRLTL